MGRREIPRRSVGFVASLAVLWLAASGSPAAGAVAIGQLAPDPSAICSSSPFDRVQTTVTSGSSYAVPATVATGTITSWSHNAAAGSGQTLTMKVFRPLGGAAYQVVGHDGPRPLSAIVPGLNTFPTSIAVKAGDVLGLNTASTAMTACVFIVGAGNLHRERPGDLPDGASDNFGPEFGTTRANITAVVAPSNSFTVDSITRNKKKGTATLRATVPNPGELSGSGKGVKVAGAAGAVLSKTVSGPGAVKLLIKARGKKKRKLNETGKVKLNVAVTYTPTGGDPATESKRLKLRKR
jgi:hypothetical protein